MKTIGLVGGMSWESSESRHLFWVSAVYRSIKVKDGNLFQRSV